MKIHQLRNATCILQIKEHHLLIDPMLGDKGSMNGFKFIGGGYKRNPIVPLPGGTRKALDKVTGCIISHCQRNHLDHLDKAGVAFLRKTQIPVWSDKRDTKWLQKKGLNSKTFLNGSLGMEVKAVPAQHGYGILGWLLGPGSGFYLSCPGEPSVYITGDTVLTDKVKDAVQTLSPDIIIAPAGSANIGMGKDILFSVEELILLAQLASGKVVFNHMEALDHCPNTRQELGKLIEESRLSDRCLLPEDGEVLELN